MTEPTFVPATPADRAQVLAMHEAFFIEDELVGFALADRTAGLDLLLAQPGRWGASTSSGRRMKWPATWS
ncbi:MAG: hypothetical protein HZY76_20765 [Anaerolineae bacterium]|nr:MAG: hypothetical protein HZY76_20765 [Anaerolineae bacterium]